MRASKKSDAEMVIIRDIEKSVLSVLKKKGAGGMKNVARYAKEK